MNYEEKYKEGLAEAMKHYNSGCATEGEKRMLERLYSELKESEDERIRKEMIEFLTDGIWRAKEISKVRETQKYAKWIAYLGKQKEQKPAGAHSYLENSVDISPSDTEKSFAEEYAYGVFEELKKKFKENGNFTITCDEASNIALNAILDGIDWFKKQAKDEKECIGREGQKPVCGYASPKFKVGDRIYDRRDSYNRNVIREVGKDYYINAFAQKMDMAYTDANFEFLEHLDDDIIPNKPAEWSEEDKGILLECISALQNSSHWLLADKLSSLHPQPHWKPSEEQINALKVVARGYPPDDPEAIESLLNDLKKFTKNEK